MERRIICYGDSNTYGYDPRSLLGERYPAQSRWTDQLSVLRPGRIVVNFGENGREIPRHPWELQRLEEALCRAAPLDALVVMLGGNDLLQMALPQAEVASQRMGALLAWLQMRRGQWGERARILLTAPPPMRRGAWVPRDILVEESRRLGECYRLLAQERGLPFADAGEWGVELAFDGVHFTQRGHAAFAQGMNRVLQMLDL